MFADIEETRNSLAASETRLLHLARIPGETLDSLLGALLRLARVLSFFPASLSFAGELTQVPSRAAPAKAGWRAPQDQCWVGWEDRRFRVNGRTATVAADGSITVFNPDFTGIYG
jgi:hypothetical protein